MSSLLLGAVGDLLACAEDGAFDLVVASLVLHYVCDWGKVLDKIPHVLKPDGRIVISTHHPAMDWQLFSSEDYFSIKQVTETWEKGSGNFEVTFWRRPLSAMCADIAGAGLVIERLVEPAPYLSWPRSTRQPMNC